MLEAGADQLSTYPLFGFSYSDQGAQGGAHLGAAAARRPGPPHAGAHRRPGAAGGPGALRGVELAAPRPGKFSSVSRHHYVGFGPSAASMTGGHFHVNTFDVDAYAAALPGRRPVALSMALAPRQEMAYWLYWRAYELFAGADDFAALFPGAGLEEVFGRLFAPFRALGLMRRVAGGFEITDAGASGSTGCRASTASPTSSGSGGAAAGRRGRPRSGSEPGHGPGTAPANPGSSRKIDRLRPISEPRGNMPTVIESMELLQVLSEAEDIAQSVNQPLTSAHQLLAFFTVPNRAEILLREKRVDEDRILAVMAGKPREAEAVSRAIRDGARSLAEGSGASESTACTCWPR